MVVVRPQRFQDQLRALHQISIAFSHVRSISDLCQQAVVLGRSELGFDRLGIWLLDDHDPHTMHGTFGIDEHGQLRDERGFTHATEAIYFEITEPHQLIQLLVDTPLFNHLNHIVGHGSAALAPLWDGARMIGYVGVDNLFAQEPLLAEQLDLLILYGATIGHACTRIRGELAREQLLAEVQQRMGALEALHTTLSEITQELELDRLLDSIIARALILLTSDHGMVAFYHAERHDLEVVVVQGWVDTNTLGMRIALGEGVTGCAAQSRQPVLVSSYQSWDHRLPQYAEGRLGTLASVPLIYRSELLGTITVGRLLGAPVLTAADVQILGMLAQQATIAIRNAQLYGEAQHQATIDALTGLYNRRYCLDRIDSELERTRRLQCPTSVALLDLDHFKRVNDQYGHHTGDLVLRQIADLLQRALPPQYVIGRYGGEEFLVLMPETDAATARQQADRLCEWLMGAAIETESAALTITASIGLATAEGGQVITSEKLVERADRNLYRAKDSGRNRVVG